jgi:quercetin dioxygenase-like cupin family protein
LWNLPERTRKEKPVMTRTEFENEARQGAYAAPVEVKKPEGYQMGGHDHPFDAFALITAGHIDIGVAGLVSRYSAGEVFRLARNTWHTESAVEQGVTYLAARRGAPAA